MPPSDDEVLAAMSTLKSGKVEEEWCVARNAELLWRTHVRLSYGTI